MLSISSPSPFHAERSERSSSTSPSTRAASTSRSRRPCGKLNPNVPAGSIGGNSARSAALWPPSSSESPAVTSSDGASPNRIEPETVCTVSSSTSNPSTRRSRSLTSCSCPLSEPPIPNSGLPSPARFQSSESASSRGEDMASVPSKAGHPAARPNCPVSFSVVSPDNRPENSSTDQMSPSLVASSRTSRTATPRTDSSLIDMAIRPGKGGVKGSGIPRNRRTISNG